MPQTREHLAIAGLVGVRARRVRPHQERPRGATTSSSSRPRRSARCSAGARSTGRRCCRSRRSPVRGATRCCARCPRSPIRGGRRAARSGCRLTGCSCGRASAPSSPAPWPRARCADGDPRVDPGRRRRRLRACGGMRGARATPRRRRPDRVVRVGAEPGGGGDLEQAIHRGAVVATRGPVPLAATCWTCGTRALASDAGPLEDGRRRPRCSLGTAESRRDGCTLAAAR
jgi:hypothetical protein